MAQAQGTQTAIALIEETTYNTTPGSPSAQVVPVKSFALAASRSLIKSETLTGNRNQAKPVQGNIDGGGSFAMEVAANSIGTLMKHLIGADSVTGVGPYAHVLDIAALPVGFILEKDHGINLAGPSRYERFSGCRIASGAFSFPQEGFPSIDVTVKAANSTFSATPLDATPTDNGHDPFSSFEGSITEGGTASAIITEMNFTVENGLDESGYVIGSNQRQSLPEGQASISGSLTALFDDEVLLNKAINGTDSAIVITLTRGDGLGSTGNEQITFDLQHLMYERTSPAIEGPNGILLSLSFQVYEQGADNGLQVTINNALATL